MSYSAEVFNVMIASPSDVPSEREIIRKTIYEWNAIHSENRKVVLLPVGWETHTTPEMGDRPQGIINKQILNKCDMLIGVFWTRLGTPTGEYESGTVEEIEKQISSEKPTMLYFSNQPVAPGSIDQDQYNLLLEFKERCKSKGLYEEYDTLSNFKEKLFRQVQITINNLDFSTSENGDSVSPNPPQTNTPQSTLSHEARTLLKEASLDRAGSVLKLQYIGGVTIQTNGKALTEGNDRRETAKWESAIDELVEQGLLTPKGTKGEIFEVTHRGYEVADLIPSNTPE